MTVVFGHVSHVPHVQKESRTADERWRMAPGGACAVRTLRAAAPLSAPHQLNPNDPI